ncbi:hypothetical protein MRX96_016483 [Rhipicephalus microplus]
MRGLWKFPRSEPQNSIGRTPGPPARRAELRGSTRRTRGKARFRESAELRRIPFLSPPSLHLSAFLRVRRSLAFFLFFIRSTEPDQHVGQTRLLLSLL